MFTEEYDGLCEDNIRGLYRELKTDDYITLNGINYYPKCGAICEDGFISSGKGFFSYKAPYDGIGQHSIIHGEMLLKKLIHTPFTITYH